VYDILNSGFKVAYARFFFPNNHSILKMNLVRPFLFILKRSLERIPAICSIIFADVKVVYKLPQIGLEQLEILLDFLKLFALKFLPRNFCPEIFAPKFFNRASGASYSGSLILNMSHFSSSPLVRLSHCIET
jgi:hypothetical protein